MSATSAPTERVLDGRYELRSLIGQGTFGRVYRGHDQRLDRPVAIKVIKPWWTEDPEWAERFELEARLMARVSDPGIVQIFDIGYDQGSLYYVAELVDGESLATRLRRGALPPSQVRDLAEQLCRALAQAHAQRVVHRDIKPENVLISRGGRVKVGDFGIARLAEGGSEGAPGTVLGTPRYMAPEQARGRAPTPATDIYGVGVVIYEMLAGRPPFTERSAVELALRHLGDPPPPLPASTPAALKRIVGRALAKEPRDRYRDALELADALAAADLGADDAPAAGQRGEEPAGRRTLAPTRVHARLTPLRIFNPGESRRYHALLAGVALLVAAVLTAALLTRTGTVRVPNLGGLRRAAVVARVRARQLRTSFTHRYSTSPAGTVVAQRPAPGSRVQDGATLQVVLSAGPPPVVVPQLVGGRATDAQAVLARLGLVAHPVQVAAPDVTPGIVVSQSPSAASDLAPRSIVNLSVAEVPRWHPLLTFAADGAARPPVSFRIRGSRWRIVYSMGYDGVCTFIFFCSGPTAQVTNTTTGVALRQFGLNQGTGQTSVFDSGPGVYEISVEPGSDTAHWSLQVEDDY